MEQHLLLGDSKDVLKTIKDGSIDLLATDPPYGIEFMGKSWDKVLPPKEIWTECYRVLKPGSFIAVMSSPRSDVLYRMIKDLEDAGFDMSFSPILWTYHTGFPKASDTSKMIDKRFGAEREVVGIRTDGMKDGAMSAERGWNDNKMGKEIPITEPSTDLAKKYEGSKLGFQPKPAVEHIIIGMKPHGQKSYIDNVLNFEALPDNIKMTYPFIQVPKPAKKEKDFGLTGEEKIDNMEINTYIYENDLLIWKGNNIIQGGKEAEQLVDMETSLKKVIDEYGIQNKNDIGWNIMSYMRNIMEQSQKENKFITETETNLITILKTLNLSHPFNTKENIVGVNYEMENIGNLVENVENTNELIITIPEKMGLVRGVKNVVLKQRWKINKKQIKAIHPTTKPVKLMSYIITLFTREGDWVLDPFLGSGTTGVASKLIGRNFVGIEREPEYMDIVKERCEIDRDELIKFFKEGK